MSSEMEASTDVHSENNEIQLEEVCEVKTDPSKINVSRKSEMTVEDYSDKSFVVLGDSTRIYKNQLRELGGRFNRNLKTGPGWIFSKKSQEKVMDFLMSVESNCQSPTNLPDMNSSTGLPQVPKSTLSTNKFRWVKYKVFQPSDNMKVVLKTKQGNSNGRVVQTESSRNDGVVDTAYVEFDGSTSLAVFCRGKWQIFGYFEDHTIYFQ